jgi:hypothetical protein
MKLKTAKRWLVKHAAKLVRLKMDLAENADTRYAEKCKELIAKDNKEKKL